MAWVSASLAKVGGNTLLSRILGFARDLVIARVFGADSGTDAFFVAFKIPNFARRLFAEGAFSMALVPVLGEYKSNRPELRRFVDDLAGTLGVLLLAVTALGVLGAPVLLLLFAPGFGEATDQHELAVEMLRLTLPYLLFVSLTALAGGVLNTFGRFGVPSFTPVLLNVSLIACALFLAPTMERPILALAWGVLTGGLAQLALQLPCLARLGLLPRPRFNLADAGVRRVFRRMVPVLFGASVTQIGLLLDTVLASFLARGSISWLYYAERLMEFPMGILGAALGIVILPKLAETHVARSAEEFSITLDRALRWALLLGAPAALGLALLAGPIIATLFYSPEFTPLDVVMASESLAAYAAGILGFLCIKVLAPGYYARQDTRTPVRFALAALLLNTLFSVVLMFPLRHTGLALGTAIAAAANAALLLRGLLRQGVYRPQIGWRILAAKGFGACCAMAALLVWGAGETADWIAMGSWERVVDLIGWLLVSGVVYFGVLFALGVRPGHLKLG